MSEENDTIILINEKLRKKYTYKNNWGACHNNFPQLLHISFFIYLFIVFNNLSISLFPIFTPPFHNLSRSLIFSPAADKIYISQSVHIPLPLTAISDVSEACIGLSLPTSPILVNKTTVENLQNNLSSKAHRFVYLLPLKMTQ